MRASGYERSPAHYTLGSVKASLRIKALKRKMNARRTVRKESMPLITIQIIRIWPRVPSKRYKKAKRPLATPKSKARR